MVFWAVAAVCAVGALAGGSLQQIVQNEKLKFVFVGGKGGVGKTTTSSALATLIAAENKAKGKGGVLLVSTDPAHSLGDAFRQNFSTTGPAVAVEGFDNLAVMEINPVKALHKEVLSWQKLVKSAKLDSVADKMHDITKWLIALPGIDEATALASIVNKLPKSKYSTVVFDTAPTGHTLKLLELPPVLEAGLIQIQESGGMLWQMKNMMAMMTGVQTPDSVKDEFEKKLKQYIAGVKNVGSMIQDQEQTNFVVVCIAEHLSVEESKRLILDLGKNQIVSTHVVVNQVISEIHTGEDLEQVRAGGLPDESKARVASALNLLSQRQALQQKYLQDLRGGLPDHTVVTLPLLPTEPAGPSGLIDFGRHLVPGGAAPAAEEQRAEL